ncbi:hypothetical protein MML48_2g00011905 [Holotrichia oblita]|uniref:Uncharacterized protein n=1 Tax=Holotrichia oblita TaxID=644536 RepID=A0ACB9TJF2_HOLOL|nr:hypothetical protein MML48_2g00011905 [Holotrichia oblita]
MLYQNSKVSFDSDADRAHAAALCPANVTQIFTKINVRKLKTKYSPNELNRMFADALDHESDDNTVTYSTKYTVSQVFSTQQEDERVKYIKTCTLMNYGLTYKNIRVLAYDYAKLLKLKATVQWETNKVAGIEWLKGFMKMRNHEIRLRKPENTNLPRSSGFNKTSVTFFQITVFICIIYILDITSQ